MPALFPHVLLPTALFILYYAAVSACCFAAGMRAGVDTGLALPRERFERALSTGLVFTGFAPFLIAVYTILLLHVLAGQDRLVFLAAHGLLLLSMILALILVRPARVPVRPAGSWRLPAASALLCLILLAAYGTTLAVRPMDNSDCLVYGVEAKILAETRDLSKRLSVLTPGERNALRGNNHPLAYVSLLATALLFPDDPVQDLPLRAAVQILTLTTFLVFCGLALLHGPSAMGLCALLFLCENYLGTALAAYSRDAFLIIPAFMVLALSTRITPVPSSLGNLTFFLASLCLTQGHTSAILYCCMLATALFLALTGVKRKSAAAAIILAALLAGGWHYYLSYWHTGTLTELEFYSHNGMLVLDTPECPLAGQSGLEPLEVVAKPSAANFGIRVAAVARTNGAASILAFLAACAGMLLMRARGTRPPEQVLAGLLMAAAFWVMLLGGLDFVTPKLAYGLERNPRYRMFTSLLSLYACGWMLSAATQKARPLVRAAVLALVLAAAAASLHQWPLTGLPMKLDRDNVVAYFKQDNGCWWPWLKELDRAGMDGGRVLTDNEYFLWYYSDQDTVSILRDPRLKGLLSAQSREEVRQEIDALNIKAIIVNDGTFTALAGTALRCWLAGPDATPMFSCEYHRGYLVR